MAYFLRVTNERAKRESAERVGNINYWGTKRGLSPLFVWLFWWWSIQQKSRQNSQQIDQHRGHLGESPKQVLFRPVTEMQTCYAVLPWAWASLLFTKWNTCKGRPLDPSPTDANEKSGTLKRLKCIVKTGAKPLSRMGFFKHTSKRVKLRVKIRVKTDIQEPKPTAERMKRKDSIFALKGKI